MFKFHGLPRHISIYTSWFPGTNSIFGGLVPEIIDIGLDAGARNPWSILADWEGQLFPAGGFVVVVGDGRGDGGEDGREGGDAGCTGQGVDRTWGVIRELGPEVVLVG